MNWIEEQKKQSAIHRLDACKRKTEQRHAAEKAAKRWPTRRLMQMCVDPQTGELRRATAGTAYAEELKRRMNSMSEAQKDELRIAGYVVDVRS